MCKESLINSNSVYWSWLEEGTTRQNFERGSPKDYFSEAWIHDWPSSLRGKQLKFLPPFLLLATVAILVGCLDCRTQLLSIFSSETTWPLETKLWWNGPWVIPFQNCVRQSRPPTNMIAVTKNKKGGWNSKNLHLWNYWANWN
jgi:hypothetical protein